MDALTTYDFYKNEYFGDSVDESSFPKWLSRATDKVNFLTYGNITDEAVEQYSEKIQLATCALIDILYQINEATKSATAKENVKSKSSGSESITYGSNETLVTAVLADKHAQNMLMQDTLKEYICDTGLMYAGF